MTQRRILITRAEPGASATAQRLTDLGYVPVVEPLFGLAPIPVQLPAFEALAFTSANGVRALAALTSRRSVPVFCVGARTADAAHAAGFIDVTSANGDAAALVQLIQQRLTPTTRLLHTGNEESRGDIAGALTAKGFHADFIATYRAEPVSHPGPTLAAHLAGPPAFDALLVHSPRGAAILKGFLNSSPSHAPIHAAAISANAASALGTSARIETAATPDEDALLRALARLFS